jgi:hypothetical protein
MEEEKARRERASAALKGAVKPMLAEEIAARATNKLTTIFVPSIIKMHPKECYNLLRDIQITRGKLRVVKFTSSTKRQEDGGTKVAGGSWSPTGPERERLE